ncbi:MAG: thioredoxin [Clostridia bacterium]|nr:thioredoxin [Clostridia bacterium]
MKEMKITSQNLDEIKNRPIVLLDFYAEWCGPCKMLSPVISEIAAERADVKVGKINVDEENALAREYNIYSIPTLVVLKDGKEVKRATGARPKGSILALLD